MHDLVIIGAGPAGITAAIYAARKRIDFEIITGDVGGQTNWTANIENYTGYQFISGIELMKRFREHLVQFKIEVRENEHVQRVEKYGDVIRVKTTKGEYETRSVVVASGRTHRKLNVPGEDRLRGKGVAYCATCDAPLFRDMDVAVVGGGNAAMDAALQLLKIARKVYVVDRESRFRADPMVVEKVVEHGHATVFHDASVKEIRGEKFVSGMVITQGGKEQELPVEGVFVEVGSVPASGFVDVLKDEAGEILVNCKCETSVPGIFAAGDVTNVPAKQIIVACGEGAKATISAFNYLSTMKEAYL